MQVLDERLKEKALKFLDSSDPVVQSQDGLALACEDGSIVNVFRHKKTYPESTDTPAYWVYVGTAKQDDLDDVLAEGIVKHFDFSGFDSEISDEQKETAFWQSVNQR